VCCSVCQWPIAPLDLDVPAAGTPPVAVRVAVCVAVRGAVCVAVRVAVRVAVCVAVRVAVCVNDQ